MGKVWCQVQKIFVLNGEDISSNRKGWYKMRKVCRTRKIFMFNENGMISNVWFGLVWFSGKSTIVSYSMPNPGFYIYIK